MIKMTGTINNREVVILGLSEGNLKRLREDRPIHIFGQEMGIGHDIIIFWGETEDKLAEMIRPLLTEDTVIRELREEKKQ